MSNQSFNKRRQLEHELNEDLKRHIISVEEIKVPATDLEYSNFYDGVKKSKKNKFVYDISDGAKKISYSKTKKTITNYDDEGKELIRTYLSKIGKKKKDNVKIVKSARSLSNDSNILKRCEKFKAFIKHDRMLNEIEFNKKDGANKATTAIRMYLNSPVYIPIAISVYSIVLGIKPKMLVNGLKNDELFNSYLKERGYYDVVMSMIDKDFPLDLEKTQIIEPITKRSM